MFAFVAEFRFLQHDLESCIMHCIYHKCVTIVYLPVSREDEPWCPCPVHGLKMVVKKSPLP